MINNISLSPKQNIIECKNPVCRKRILELGSIENKNKGLIDQNKYQNDKIKNIVETIEKQNSYIKQLNKTIENQTKNHTSQAINCDQRINKVNLYYS